MNKFSLQLSLRPQTLDKYVEALRASNISHDFFSVYADCNQIGNFPEGFENGNYISLAGIKAVKISCEPKEENFFSKEEFEKYSKSYQKSFFYKSKEKFDQNYYVNLGLPLINQNSLFLTLEDNLQRTFEKDMFIKPTSDLKGFNGGIIKAGETIAEYMEKTTRQIEWIKELSLVSPLKEIKSEYRFFVVDGEVITGSRYMIDGIVSTSPIIPEEVLKKAQELAPKYQPDNVFTMDLGLLKNGEIEIVEYNCFNGSGVYDADVKMLVNILSKLDLSKKLNYSRPKLR